MNRAILRGLLAAALALVLVVAVLAVRGYERTLAEGRVVLFELAPVDPRSLMQGDFMALDFAVNREMASAWEAIGEERKPPPYMLVELDQEGRASFAGFAAELPAAEDPRLALKLHMEHGAPGIGPNAFFFQEGTADRYATAAWGTFRVADDGTALLTSLRDADLETLGEVRR